ncbi:hypothetical protein BGZ68_004669 [Mortierella alpina]|nr:hypothetical protein BGZ68_004669 [Mortierella alpina]
MLHVLLGIFGIWIAVYRNEGFSRKIVTKLFTIVESGIQPKPVDCVVFFMTIASFSKVPANVLLMLDSLSTTKWVRIAFEQVYWIALVVACTSYFIGLLNAMPVTKRDGIWAIYEPEYAPGYGTQDAVHVLYPNTYSKNVILVARFIIPVVCCTGPAIASGVLYDHGSFRASRALLVVRHTGWGVVLYSMALICLYYGLKCTLILRANTIVSKTVLKAPEATFGTSCSKAISHARYLFVMLQITGAGVSVAASEDGLLPTPSIYMDSSPEPSASKDPYKNEHLLCDWMITASHCREADLTKRILIASTAMHCCVGFFGIWVMTYRSGGFSIAILKDLVDTGDGVRIRPKPIRCGYGLLSTRSIGIFAYYEPDLVPGSTKGYSIRVIYPSPLVRDLFLASSFLIPTIFCAGPAIASGVMHDLGHFEASEVLRTIRHINWVGIFYTIPVIAFYYSVKFALILWANIRLAESTLRVEPKAAFTIEYLLTMSPVRFLVILMTFTTFGAGAISIMCGSIVLFYLIYRHEILRWRLTLLTRVILGLPTRGLEMH